MLDFDTLIKTKADTIRAVFVSDLHLYPQSPINASFIHLVHQLATLPHLQGLFILGDFLDGWIGDPDLGKPTHWLNPIFDALSLIHPVYIMHGNRDFMIDQSFCDYFGGKLVAEPFFVYHKGQRYRLEHGDKLCTDDVAYQRYRTVIRHPITHTLLSKSPQRLKYHLKRQIKRVADITPTEQKKRINTNPHAVQKAHATCDHLIYGHTHKPRFDRTAHKSVMVLGDWYIKQGSVQAVFGVLTDTLMLATLCIKQCHISRTQANIT